jgi:hypothetical protein
MDISAFILDIGQKIKLISRVEPNFPQECTVPEEEWIAESPEQEKMSLQTGIRLRTAEQTKSMDVVKLQRFNPYFWDREPKCIPGCVAGCRKRKRSLSSEEVRTKPDLFLCKTHHANLTDLVSKHCTRGNITENVASFKNDEFKGYTSLIGILEKAYMHLHSNWWFRLTSVDYLLAEVFLNTRNFLIITSALMSPDEDNTVTALGLCLTKFKRCLENLESLQCMRGALREAMIMLLQFFGVGYKWVILEVEDVPFLGTGGCISTYLGFVGIAGIAESGKKFYPKIILPGLLLVAGIGSILWVTAHGWMRELEQSGTVRPFPILYHARAGSDGALTLYVIIV